MSMRRALLVIALLGCGSSLASSQAQSPSTPGPKATIMTAGEIAAALDKAGSAAATMTGTDAQVAPGVVVRRRASGGAPQYAIIHPLSIEIYQIVEGSGTLTTGGVIDPPVAPDNPDLVRSQKIVGGESRKVGKGDVVVMQPGTPHWFNEIDGSITYLEARIRVK
jgi:mannose-6-phosphate isomerase-like protein (cupin superfamily)